MFYTVRCGDSTSLHRVSSYLILCGDDATQTENIDGGWTDRQTKAHSKDIVETFHTLFVLVVSCRAMTVLLCSVLFPAARSTHHSNQANSTIL